MKAHGVVMAMPQEQELGADTVDRNTVNVGTVRRRPRLVRPVRERAGTSSADGVGQGGGCVVVAGVTTRRRGPGKPDTGRRRPASQQLWDWNVRRRG
jgi:hypothetical protein